MKTPKSHSEINWPVEEGQIELVKLVPVAWRFRRSWTRIRSIIFSTSFEGLESGGPRIVPFWKFNMKEYTFIFKPAKVLQGVSHWRVQSKLALTGRKIDNSSELWCLVPSGGSYIWVSSTRFQKSNISWPHYWGLQSHQGSWIQLYFEKNTTFFVGGCWGQPMLHFWKLVDETQIYEPPEATRHHNLTHFYWEKWHNT